ncbi:hypothetical protein ACFPIK_11010 [Algoriphagus aquatilis]|uniref:DUF1049 domain-containing protein n=1 Tax=Algoriphagus aquatilis TaxID=490186 RepID=A0ABW0BY64_9BACT|nr:hypothetical protein [Algoriphagus sp.]
MRTIAFYLQLILLAFFLVFLVLFVFFDSLGALVGMEQISPEIMGRIFLLGLILFLFSWGATTFGLRILRGKFKKMESEMNEVKAKLYDLEHPKVRTISQSVPQKNQEEQSGMIRPRQNFTDQ